MDANTRKGIRRKEKLARRAQRQGPPRVMPAPEPERRVEETDRTYRVFPRSEPRPQLCAGCGAPLVGPVKWLDLSEVYDPLSARIVEMCIRQAPPLRREIDIIDGGRIVEWTDAQNERHQLDVGTMLFGDQEDGEEPTPSDAIDPLELATVLQFMAKGGNN